MPDPAENGYHFAGRSAVVTGSSRGIGRAVAHALAAQGAAVIVNGRDPEVARQAAEEIAGAADVVASGGTAVAVSGSPSEPEVAEALIAAAVEATGRIDVLVNCAGTAEPSGSSILNVTTAQWNELIESHLNTTFQTCRVAASQMVAAGGGAIVNTSSHAFLGIYGGTGYAAGKGAVNSLTAAIAAELREHNVRANVVCPGATTRLSTGTDYEQHLRDLHERGLLDDLMLAGSQNPGSPEHVASLYAFLASDLAAGITGEVFVGAGGYVGRFPKSADEFVTWRDHATNPPNTLEELAAILGG